MNSTDLEANAFFTTNGKDIWQLLYFCHYPTCTLKNLTSKNGEEEDFGMGGLTAQRFHRIKMPEIEEDFANQNP